MSTPNAQALSQLRATAERFYALTDAAWADFASIWEMHTARRKVILSEQGGVERYLYYVLAGVQRAYAVDAVGREATLLFTYPPSFAGVLDSLLLQQPAQCFFETLTPSVFLRTDFYRLDQMMQRHHSLERMVRLGVTYSLSGVWVRQIELQTASAEERFRALLRRSPHILQLVPHKYLANYLGMDATNFSKFLASVRI